jgi:hypothetical protein
MKRPRVDVNLEAGPELGAPIQMCDALSRNTPKLSDGAEILLANCLAASGSRCALPGVSMREKTCAMQRLGNAEAGLSKRSDCIIEDDESCLIGLIQHGERAGTLSPLRAASCLPACSSMSTTSACTSIASAIASLSPRSSCAKVRLPLGLRTRRLSKRKKDELDLIRLGEAYPVLRALYPDELLRQFKAT